MENHADEEKMREAVNVIRSTTIGKVLKQEPYPKYKDQESLAKLKRLRDSLHTMFVESGSIWRDDTELGAIMTALNRKHPTTYIRAVNALKEWSKYVDENLGNAFRLIEEDWLMHRVYFVSNDKTNHNLKTADSLYGWIS